MNDLAHSKLAEQRCPWSGHECECQQFPWLELGKIPPTCSALIRDKAPAMIVFRKLTGENNGVQETT